MIKTYKDLTVWQKAFQLSLFIQTLRKPWPIRPRMKQSSEQTLRAYARKPRALIPRLFIYRITKRFPKEELYTLVSQMRRAAISIPSNIAEGYCRQRKLEYIQFLQIAFASGAELETQLLISRDLGHISLGHWGISKRPIIFYRR